MQSCSSASAGAMQPMTTAEMLNGIAEQYTTETLRLRHWLGLNISVAPWPNSLMAGINKLDSILLSTGNACLHNFGLTYLIAGKTVQFVIVLAGEPDIRQADAFLYSVIIAHGRFKASGIIQLMMKDKKAQDRENPGPEDKETQFTQQHCLPLKTQKDRNLIRSC
jgi:hypothetical protein